MRQAMIVVWLLVPLAMAAYHYGPGQEKVRTDDAGIALFKARTFVGQQKWPEAVAAFDEGLKLLPTDRVHEIRQVRLEKAKAQMMTGQLPESRAEFEALVDELSNDKSADPKQLAEARSALANAQYYVTWILRLEGEPKEVWEPEIDSARQTYRLLAEQAVESKDSAGAKRATHDLESSIRLARMDLSDLQGLSLPSQCKNCSGGECKKCACKKPGKKPGGEKKKEDARGASSGPPPDKSGS